MEGVFDFFCFVFSRATFLLGAAFFGGGVFFLRAVVAFLFLAIPSTSLKVGLLFNAHGSKRRGEFHCPRPINPPLGSMSRGGGRRA